MQIATGAGVAGWNGIKANVCFFGMGNRNSASANKNNAEKRGGFFNVPHEEKLTARAAFSKDTDVGGV